MGPHGPGLAQASQIFTDLHSSSPFTGSMSTSSQGSTFCSSCHPVSVCFLRVTSIGDSQLPGIVGPCKTRRSIVGFTSPADSKIAACKAPRPPHLTHRVKELIDLSIIAKDCKVENDVHFEVDFLHFCRNRVPSTEGRTQRYCTLAWSLILIAVVLQDSGSSL